jgi:hypothetical protein
MINAENRKLAILLVKEVKETQKKLTLMEDNLHKVIQTIFESKDLKAGEFTEFYQEIKNLRNKETK